MYVHPRLKRFLASLDLLESNLKCRGHNRFTQERGWKANALGVQTAKEFIEREPSLPGQPVGISFRHSCWFHDRNRVYRAMAKAKVSESTRTRFNACGRRQWVVREKAGQRRFRVMGNYCKSRWCVPCSRSKAYVIRQALASRMFDGPTRFVTLTLRHDAKPLRVMLDKLYACFRRLQLTELWKTCVTAGASFLEIKVSKADGEWHPHLHVLVKGKYLPVKKLSQVWHAITKDSYIVDVNLVRDDRKIVHYVTKYLTKPLDASVLRSEPHLIEAIDTLQGRRSLITLGEWRGTPLKPKTEPCEYEPVAYLDTLLEHARNGTMWALEVYGQIRRLPNSGKSASYVVADDYDP